MLAAALAFRCGGGTDRPTGPDDEPQKPDAGQPTNPVDGGPWSADDAAVAPQDSGETDANPSGDAGNEVVIEWNDDDSQPPPPLDPNQEYDMPSATRFLYEGDNPIQSGVLPGTIRPEYVAVIRGKVRERSGAAIPNVIITVLDHPEYGQSRTRRDGEFDLAVNGGATLTVSFAHPDYLPLQRQASAPWQGWVRVEEVVLTKLDPLFTEVSLSTLTEPVVAEGSPMEDADGLRTARVVFEPGVSASMRLPNGTEVPLDHITVRATEYTVGDDGPKAMPAELPPTSMYTYAVELSVDEAMAAGATTVNFSKPVPLYVDNFLDVPVGLIVPVGLYDRTCGCWIPSDNGRVLKVLAVEDGRALLDVDGEGETATPARLEALGITGYELEVIALEFDAGDTFWRSPIPHFTPVDCNFGGGLPPPPPPPPGCENPPCEEEPDDDEDCDQAGGSTISCMQRNLRETIPIPGTDRSLVYSSRDSVSFAKLAIPVTGDEVHPELKRAQIDVTVLGQTQTKAFAPAPRLHEVIRWDGRDAWGRPVSGIVPATVSVSHTYPVVYSEPSGAIARAFMSQGGRSLEIDRSFSSISMITTYQTAVRSPIPSAAGQNSGVRGGWSFDGLSEFDPTTHHVRRGDGSRYSPPSTWKPVITKAEILDALQPYGVTDVLWAGGHRLEFCEGAAATWPNVGALAATEDGGYYIFVVPGSDPTSSWQLGGGPFVLLRKSPQGEVSYLGGLAPHDPRTGRCPTNLPSDEIPAEGVDARDVCFSSVRFSEAGPGGSLYFVASAFPSGNGDGAIYGVPRIYRVSPEGRVHHIAGSLGQQYTGGGTARTSAIGGPVTGLAVGQDCAIYVSTHCYVLKITPDGELQPFFGRNPAAPMPSSGWAVPAGCSEQPYFPAATSGFEQPGSILGLDVSPQGDLYVGSMNATCSGLTSLHRVSSTGTVERVAGAVTLSPNTVTADDGALAVNTRLTPAVAFRGTKNGLLILDYLESSGGHFFWEDPFPRAFEVRNGRLVVVGRAAHPNGKVNGRYDYWIPVKLTKQGHGLGYFDLGSDNAVGQVDLSDVLLSASDPQRHRLYEFDAERRHVRTLHLDTGAVLEEFGYDNEGRLVTLVNESGSRLDVERASDGQPTAFVASAGDRTELRYGGGGLLEEVRLPNGGAYRMGYAAGGLMTRFERPDGRVSSMRYDDDGQLVEDSSSDGQGWTLTREALDNNRGLRVRVKRLSGEERQYAIERMPTGGTKRTVTGYDGTETVTLFRPSRELTTYPDGTSMALTFAPDPRLGTLMPYVSRTELRNASVGANLVTTHERVTEFTTAGDQGSPVKTQTDRIARGSKTRRVVYDSASLVTSVVDETSLHGVHVQHDGQGRFARVQEEDRSTQVSRTWRLERDANGRVLHMDGPRIDVEDLERFEYDNHGRLIAQIDALGHRTSFGPYDPEGRIRGTVLPGGLEESYAYDAAGRIVEMRSGDRIKRFGYLEAGRISTMTMPEGGAWTFIHGGPERGLSEIRAPSGGRMVLTQSDATQSASLRILDAADTERARFDLSTSVTDSRQSVSAGSLVTSTRYHPVWKKPVEVGPSGRVTRFEYDGEGLLSRLRTPSGTSTAFQFDPTGRLVVRNPLGLESTFTPNAFGDVVSFRNPAGGARTYTQDAAGNMASETDARGITVTFARDAFGRVTALDYPGEKEDVSVSYDEPPNGTGRMTSIRDGSGSTGLSYDRYGQLVERSELIDSTMLSVRYAYDANGSLVELIYPSGMRLTITRDADDRVRAMSVRFVGESSDRSIIRDALHIPFGPVSRFVLGDAPGTVHERSYDAGLRMTRIRAAGIVDWVHTYDAFGNVTSIEEALGPGEPRTQTLVHDLDGRLTRSTEPATYGTIAYAYNGVGDRTSASRNGVTTTYSYDPPTGRLRSTSESGQPATTLEYDGSGRAVRHGDWSFEYSGAGHMARATNAATNLEVSSVYNARHQRVKKTVSISSPQSEESVLFMYEGLTQLLGEYSSSGAPLREMVWLDSTPIASIEHTPAGPQILFIHADRLDTPRNLTDISGRIVWSWQSDPFGELSANEDVDGDGRFVRFNPRFPGQYFDRETGLYENHHRTYNPRLGRYLQSDPMAANTLFESSYSYVRNAPTAWVDPVGLETLPGTLTNGERVGIGTVKGDYGSFAKRNGLDSFVSLKNYLKGGLDEAIIRMLDNAKEVHLNPSEFDWQRFKEYALRNKLEPNFLDGKTNAEVLYMLKNHPEKLVITLPDGSKINGVGGLPKILSILGKFLAFADILTIQQLVQMMREVECSQGNSAACTPEVIESICAQVLKCGGQMPLFCPI